MCSLRCAEPCLCGRNAFAHGADNRHPTDHESPERREDAPGASRSLRCADTAVAVRLSRPDPSVFFYFPIFDSRTGRQFISDSLTFYLPSGNIETVYSYGTDTEGQQA